MNRYSYLLSILILFTIFYDCFALPTAYMIVNGYIGLCYSNIPQCINKPQNYIFKLEDFSANVTSYMKRGWQPIGGVIFQNHNNNVYQSMVY
jgi:hypothetical protein